MQASMLLCKCLSLYGGTWERVVGALLLDPLPLLPGPVLLAAQVWNVGHFVIFTNCFSRRSCQSSYASAPSLNTEPFALGWGAGFQGLAREVAVTSLLLGIAGTTSWTESDRGGCGLAKEPGVLRVKTGGWGGTG